jgi:DNA-binding transcriptional regulator LsrR (DeoR family)
MDAEMRAATADPAPADPIVRAAWLYYEEGLTQATIARLMGVSRGRVIALLASARDQGVVQVHIAAQSRAQGDLEAALRERFGLAEAVVVPSPVDEAQVAAMVGHAVGEYVSRELRDGMTLGVGWGATLHMAQKSIASQPRTGVSVMSLLGSTTHSRAINPPAVARRMADAFRAECYQLTAPLFVSDEPVRDALWNEPALRDLRERARTLDIALASVGELGEEATLFRTGVLSQDDLDTLRATGAVGDLLCRFVDANGRIVDHPVNRRVMAIDLAMLRNARRIVIASGGRRKVAALHAAMHAVPVSALITDEAAARGLVDG